MAGHHSNSIYDSLSWKKKHNIIVNKKMRVTSEKKTFKNVEKYRDV